MKLVWHMFQKDLRRMALPLALWGVVIMMQHLVWRHLLLVGESESDSRLILVLWGLHLLAAWLLVPVLIHDDPLIGDNAPWRVRPISGARLLAAKLLGLAVMLWLWPSLLTVPWWLKLGFGPGEIVRAVAVNMLGMAAFTGVALLVAVLTEDLGRFIAWSIVLAVAAGLDALLLVASMPALDDGPTSPAVLFTRTSFGGVLALAAVIVVVVLQFLRRRTRLARGIAFAAAALITLVAQFWPWSAATMLARTGLNTFALPSLSARLMGTTLAAPADAQRQDARVAVGTEFAVRGLAGTDLPTWSSVDPLWRMGNGRLVGQTVPIVERRPVLSLTAEAVARGPQVRRETSTSVVWQTKLPGRLTTELRNGIGMLTARYDGALWRGERGATAAARTNAGGGSGLQQLHVVEVWPHGGRWNGWNGYESHEGEVSWIETEPLFTPKVILEMLNTDGVSRHRGRMAVLMNGKKALAEEDRLQDGLRLGARNAFPVGVIGVVPKASVFQSWRQTEHDSTRLRAEDLLGDGATLTIVNLEEVAPLAVPLTETPFVPELVIEGRLEDALHRAQTADKLVLVRVVATPARESSPNVNAEAEPAAWRWPKVRELLLGGYVCAQITEAEAGTLSKRVGEDMGPRVFVLTPAGKEQDRLRDLPGWELANALRANLAGRTYVDFLREALAAKGNEDRNLRFYFLEAMRARGELTGVLDSMMWVVDHPTTGVIDRSEITTIGQRLEQFVGTFGSGEAELMERRAEAVANLRRDPKDVAAARRLFAITLGLRHEDAVWREFPRLLPRENPSWWEFMAIWMGRTVGDQRLGEHRYHDVTDAIDVEQFIADGPAWVRAQLARRLALWYGEPATVEVWQNQLVWAGKNGVEALAGAGEGERALRVAHAVLRINSSGATRALLVNTLQQVGAVEQAKKLIAEKRYVP